MKLELYRPVKLEPPPREEILKGEGVDRLIRFHKKVTRS